MKWFIVRDLGWEFNWGIFGALLSEPSLDCLEADSGEATGAALAEVGGGLVIAARFALEPFFERVREGLVGEVRGADEEEGIGGEAIEEKLADSAVVVGVFTFDEDDFLDGAELEIDSEEHLSGGGGVLRGKLAHALEGVASEVFPVGAAEEIAKTEERPGGHAVAGGGGIVLDVFLSSDDGFVIVAGVEEAAVGGIVEASDHVVGDVGGRIEPEGIGGGEEEFDESVCE